MKPKLLKYEDLKDFVGKFVYVYYVDKKWGLCRDDLINGYHTVKEDYEGVYDLYDSKADGIGSVDTCIEKQRILVFSYQPLLSELLEVCKRRDI